MKSVPFQSSDFNPEISSDEIFKLIDRFRLIEYVSRESDNYWIAVACSDVISSLFRYLASEVNYNETQNETE